MKQEYKKIAEVAVLAGRIMLESQAESYRIEDTVERILKTSQCQTTEVFANTTGLFVTLDDPSIEPITIVRRIKHRGTHLRKIHHVNNISRQLTKGEISLEEARVRLEKVDVSEYTLFHFDLAVFFLVVSFAVLLGGSIWDIAVSGLAALLVIFGYWLQGKLAMNALMTGTVATFFLGSIMPFVLLAVPQPHNLDIIIISALMPLFPGTAFTNGIRDTLKGDYVSGMAKIAEALVIAVSLGLGVALGLFVSNGVLSL